MVLRMKNLDSLPIFRGGGWQERRVCVFEGGDTLIYTMTPPI